MQYNILSTAKCAFWCFLLLCVYPTFSQSINDFSCYTTDGFILYEHNPLAEQWEYIDTIVSYFNLSHRIEATAIIPGSNILYAVDHNIFGLINTNTAEFTALSYVSNQSVAFGEYGNQLLDDISAMSYDPYAHCIWAINCNAGFGPGTEDFLIKIDPDTGYFIQGAFENGYDYAVIPSVYDGALGSEVYDVEAITLDPYSGILYAAQSQNGPGVLTTIDLLDGAVESVIFDFGEYNIKGLSLTSNGRLLGIGESNSSAYPSLIEIDQLNAAIHEIGSINFAHGHQGFETLTCNTGIFDLALKVELAINPNSISSNSNLTCNITIKNQGDLEIDSYTLSAYLPVDLNLNDNDWSMVSDQKIKKQVDLKIEPGQTKVTTLDLKISNLPTYNLQLACEISEMFNHTINEANGFKVTLPDIDSTPDCENNETNIVDNAISQGGPKANQDEDDHDITIIIMPGNHCVDTLNLSGLILGQEYVAERSIISDGSISPYSIVRFSSGFIYLEPGFNIGQNSSFAIEIGGCP